MEGNTGIAPGLSPGIRTGSVPAGGGMPGGNRWPDGSFTVTAPNALTGIVSEDIRSFEIRCRFEGPCRYSYVYAYASRVDLGTLACLVCRGGDTSSRAETYSAVAVVDGDIFAELQKIVKDHDFIRRNGYSHSVSGLPGNFGGSVEVVYSSGESISFSDNQGPVISSDAGTEIADTLRKHLEMKHIMPLTGDDIVSVRYREDRGPDGYSDMLLADRKFVWSYKFGEVENRLTCEEADGFGETMKKIRQMADENALLYWSGLLETPNPIVPGSTEQLLFTTADGSRHMINGTMKAPEPAGNCLIKIKMLLMDQQTRS